MLDAAPPVVALVEPEARAPDRAAAHHASEPSATAASIQGSWRLAEYDLGLPDPLGRDPSSVHGLVAISASLRNAYAVDEVHALVGDRRPVGRVGESILLYELP